MHPGAGQRSGHGAGENISFDLQCIKENRPYCHTLGPRSSDRRVTSSRVYSESIIDHSCCCRSFATLIIRSGKRKICILTTPIICLSCLNQNSFRNSHRCSNVCTYQILRHLFRIARTKVGDGSSIAALLQLRGEHRDGDSGQDDPLTIAKANTVIWSSQFCGLARVLKIRHGLKKRLAQDFSHASLFFKPVHFSCCCPEMPLQTPAVSGL